jgi:hypothetical protein
MILLTHLKAGFETAESCGTFPWLTGIWRDQLWIWIFFGTGGLLP